MNTPHPHCSTGFTAGDHVRRCEGGVAGVVAEGHYHVFDAGFRPRVFVEWEDGIGNGPFLPADIVKLNDQN